MHDRPFVRPCHLGAGRMELALGKCTAADSRRRPGVIRAGEEEPQLSILAMFALS